MQIVIDIPDGYVGVIMSNQKIDGSAMDKLIRQAVIDGIPLPKGHGRLIDADYKVSSDGRTIDAVCGYMAPTIIDADKEV